MFICACGDALAAALQRPSLQFRSGEPEVHPWGLGGPGLGNSDFICAAHFYEQGKADAVKDVVNKSKNLSDTKARTTQGDVFIGGLKVKAISGADSTKLKIKTRKFN